MFLSQIMLKMSFPLHLFKTIFLLQKLGNGGFTNIFLVAVRKSKAGSFHRQSNAERPPKQVSHNATGHAEQC
jgi:hypothetical protein